MKIRRRIEFKGRNLNDVFGLPCVKMILKSGEGEPILVMRPDKLFKAAGAKTRTFAEVGNVLVQYDNGEWEVEA